MFFWRAVTRRWPSRPRVLTGEIIAVHFVDATRPNGIILHFAPMLNIGVSARIIAWGYGATSNGDHDKIVRYSLRGEVTRVELEQDLWPGLKFLWRHIGRWIWPSWCSVHIAWRLTDRKDKKLIASGEKHVRITEYFTRESQQRAATKLARKAIKALRRYQKKQRRQTSKLTF